MLRSQLPYLATLAIRFFLSIPLGFFRCLPLTFHDSRVVANYAFIGEVIGFYVVLLSKHV